MSSAQRYILEQKGYFPCSIADLFARIELPYELRGGIDPSALIRGITADKPEPQSLLIVDHQTDDELRDSIKRGVTAVVAARRVEGVPCVAVESVWEFARRLTGSMYSLIGIPVVIVTGSEGKTTTKRMVNCVVSTEKNTFCQYDGRNIVLNLCAALTKIPVGTELFVREADESGKKSLLSYSKLLKPEIALVTNIAEAHLGSFGSKEALIESFRGITAGMDENGIVIINRDDRDSVAASFDKNVVSVGIYDSTADCVARNIKEGETGVEFDVVYAGETEHIRLSIHGEHNVYNAMMAYVVGKLEGIGTANIKKGLLSYRNSGIRQNVCSLGDTLIYADCYNASATSVGFALKCFDALPSHGRKKVAVLGDIAEIEGFEEDTYRRIATALDATGVDVLVTCGKDSEMIHSFVTRAMAGKHTRDLKELNAYLRTLKRGGGNYLFKASRIMTLEESIQAVFPKHYAKLTGQKSGLTRTAKRALSKVKRTLMKKKRKGGV